MTHALRLLAGLAAAAALTAGGCAGGKTLRPGQLPRHFIAQKTENAQTLDLARLAVNTNSAERIVPGDVLEVAIAAGLGADDASVVSARVDAAGDAVLPEIGPVRVAGLELEDAESAISTQSVQRGLYRAPHVTVTMKQPKMFQVTVVGGVDEPGTVELRPGQSDLLHAIVAAGSLSENAGTKVEIRQNGLARPGGTQAPLVADASAGGGGLRLVGHQEAAALPAGLAGETVTVDLVSATRTGGGRYGLTDGAVVHVETKDPAKISIGGLVKKPATYDFPVGEDLRLLHAIQMAGDTPNIMADKVFVVREVDRGGRVERAVIQASIRKAKHTDSENLRLMPGDIVSVERTPSTVFLETLSMIGFNVGARIP